MPPALLHKFPTSSPSDTTPLTSLLKLGYTRSDILGIIGKTEGNGCVNDFSRTLAAFVWENLLLSETDTSTGTGTSTGGTSVVIFSGGTEGVLSPHVTFVVRERQRQSEKEKGEGKEGEGREKRTGLKAAVGRTWQLQPWEIGGKSQVDCVAVTVRKMLEEEKIRPEQVALVLVKCPLLTSEKIAKIHAFSSSSSRNEQLITSDAYESMALSRHASAIGVGVGLRELAPERVEEVLNNGTFHSSRASCSSGAELEACHILILANDDNPSPSSPTSSSSSPSTEEKEEEEAEKNQPPTLYRAFPGTMSSAIDITNLQTLLHTALTPLPPYTSASLIQIFAKAEADPTGMINQKYRHTMLTDSDVQSTRHARAAVGGLIAGVSGDCCVYVSGGAEGQGPRGGGGLCVVVRWEM